MWPNKHFHCHKYEMTALFKNGRQNSLTPQRKGHLSTSLLQSLTIAILLYLWPHFTSCPLRQWLKEKPLFHNYMRSQNHPAFPSCGYDAYPWTALIALQRRFPRLSSFPHSPAHPPHGWPSPVSDARYHFATTNTARHNGPWRNSSLLFHQLREINCLQHSHRSAKIISAILGKIPGYAIFMLKMENWGQYSYYNFLNSKSLKIMCVCVCVCVCVCPEEGLGSSWASGWEAS
jgi:hypothetical protein